MLKHNPFLIVISAPSGSGKTSIVEKIRKKVDNLVYSISYTTRKPRPGEKHGENYFFVTEEEFLKKVDEGYFLEWTKIYGDYYGTPKPFVEENLKKGFDVLLDLDVQGKRTIEKIYKDNVVSVFVVAPTLQELRERLIKRNRDNIEELQIRLKEIEKEMDWIHEYDYVVLNDELENAVKTLEAIIIAERSKLKRKIT